MRKLLTVSLLSLVLVATAGCECWDCFMRFESWKNQTLFGCGSTNACSPYGANYQYAAPACDCAGYGGFAGYGGDCAGVMVQSPLMSQYGAGGCCTDGCNTSGFGAASFGTSACGPSGCGPSGCGPAGCGTTAPGMIVTQGQPTYGPTQIIAPGQVLAPGQMVAPGQMITPGTTVVPGPETYAPAIQ